MNSDEKPTGGEGGEEEDDMDEILALLKNPSDVELPDKVSNSEEKHKSVYPDVEEASEPLYLADFNISMPEPPSEKQMQAQSLDYFSKILRAKFNFETMLEFNKALKVIERFEIDE